MWVEDMSVPVSSAAKWGASARKKNQYGDTMASPEDDEKKEDARWLQLCQTLYWLWVVKD